MAVNVIGVPTTRVSNAFITNRLMSQVTFDQVELYRLQTQLSTGLQFQRPGEEPIAAANVLSYQIELERKGQSHVNLNSTASYLAATDTALSQVSDLMNEMRALGLEAINTTTSDVQRGAIAQQVSQAVRQLMDSGNQQFRDRYLFSGSATSTRPFEFKEDQYVIEYFGNETHLDSFVDVNLLYASNMSGKEVFNAISDPVLGSADIDPALTENTLIASLNGGEGVELGSIEVSNGAAISTVDLANCETIGDVAERLRRNPPTGAVINATVTPTGLRIWLDPSTPGDLQIHEVGNGSTAAQLGIYTATGVGMLPIEGEDLNPIVRRDTPLDNLFGASSMLACQFPGNDNDFMIRATRHDATLNGMTVQLESQPGLSPGGEYAELDGATNTLTVYTSPDGSIAADVVAAAAAPALINGATEFPFTVELDPVDEYAGGGSGLVPLFTNPYVIGRTEYGEDGTVDRSGLQIVNGKETYTISFAGLNTVQEMLNEINGAEAGVVAQINAAKTGIDIRSKVSGADFMIGENFGLTATQFGVRTLIATTELDELNYGRGVMDYDGPGAKATAEFDSIAENSGIVFRALNEGEQWNDYDIRFVDTTDPTGAVTIAWDQLAQTITIGITPGVSTANDVIDAFRTQVGPRDAFEVYLDTSVNTGNTGEGVLYKGTTTTDGGEDGGIDFTILRHDGVVLDIDINVAEDIGDVLNIINSHPDNADGYLTASLTTDGNGIVLTDDSTGQEELTVTRSKLSLAAIDLGLIPEGQESQTETFPGTIAQVTADPAGADNTLVFRGRYPGDYANDVTVVYTETPAPPATSFNVSVDPLGNYVFTFEIESTVTTAQDIVDMFNASGLTNITDLFEVVPTGAATGTIDLTATGDLTYTLADGESANVEGTDPNPLETESLFTALLRLQEGLEHNDMLLIQRSVEILDEAVVSMNYARTDSGAQQQSLDFLKYRLDEEDVELRSVLSKTHDADMVEVISNLTTRQVAMEAGFKAIADTFRLSLIEYL